MFGGSVSVSTIAHLTGEKLAKLAIMLPPIKLQMEFSKKLKTVKEQALKQSLASSASDHLFLSLQHRAFTGELTSKDIERELAIAG